MNRVALLFSHFPKRICGVDEPLVRLKAAVAFLKSQDVSVVTSAGQTHWDCILTAMLDNKIPVSLVIPKPISQAEISEQFSYEFELCEVVETVEERDKFICSVSDRLYPLWLRRGGRISKIVDSFSSGVVDYSFDCSPYRFSNSGIKYLLPESSVELRLLPDDYLWHWTRGADGLWVGETRREYCRDLLSSASPPRDGISTLCRILSERRIRASGQHIAANIPVTSFTSNHPSRSKAMFTWRADLQQMNFEPYGIGIPREYAKTKGLQPLQYGENPNWNRMQTNNRWRNENEWRVRDDFFLDAECMHNMIVVTRNKKELPQIQKFFTGKTVSYE